MYDENGIALQRCMARITKMQEKADRKAKAITFFGIFIAVVFMSILLVGGKVDREFTEKTVMVHNGDTLWNIAKEYCPSHMDIRRYINLIQEDNDCSADIHYGDILTVRCYEE